MRVLGRTRLSRSSEESTSIERQKEIIRSWADQNGHEVIGWADDIGVSGSVGPFAAPALGPWLSDTQADQWDILCAWKMDRLARRTVPLHRLFGWTQDNHKTLVCVADNIDLDHWVGRLVASVIAGVAEGELEAIRERNTASRKKLREVGRWHGGRPFYGYTPVPLDTGGWTFEHDPDAVKTIQVIVEEVLEGKAVSAIADELTKSGVLSPADHYRVQKGQTPKGSKWTGTAVFRILRSQSLLGWSLHEKRAVRDDQGLPVLKGPPILERAVFDQVQTALDNRKLGPQTKNTSPLLGVAVCWTCGRNLNYRYNQKIRKQGEYYGYFYCPDKCHPQVNGEALVQMVYDLFLDELGDYEELEKQVHQPTDNSARIADIEQAISELAEMFGNMSSSGNARVRKQIEALDAELAELESEHSTESLVKWKPTGRKYADIWNQSSPEAKRQLMLKAGIRVRARPERVGSSSQGRGTVRLDFAIPTDLDQKLRSL